ncbi:hypothetical protein ACHAW6_006177, partial [Cyclotella cf. meneghiniana]
TARGKDLSNGENLADYIDPHGRVDLISFYGDHTKYFPTKYNARHLVMLLNLLGVRNYERLARLGSILNIVYIEPEWVAKEYLCCSKKGSWKEESNKEALKFWNLEHIIEAETFGLPVPDELTMDALLSDNQERAVVLGIGLLF